MWPEWSEAKSGDLLKTCFTTEAQSTQRKSIIYILITFITGNNASNVFEYNVLHKKTFAFSAPLRPLR
jgi:hypothetical protein